MIRKALTITVVAVTCNSGCSIISQRFPDIQFSNQIVNIESTKVMLYDFIDPRRKQVSTAQGNIPSPQASYEETYFSASGHLCKVVTRRSQKPVCLINGNWQEAAPIFESTPYKNE